MDYIRVEAIIEAVQRYPVFNQAVISPADYKEWAFEAIHKIGMINVSEKAEVVLDVAAYKAKLPIDVHRIFEVRNASNNTPYDYAGKESLRKGMYTESGGHLHFPFSEGAIKLSYTFLPVDDTGAPLIPDLQGYRKAVEAYLLERTAFKGFLMSNVTGQVYNLVRQEWGAALDNARSEARELTPDSLASINKVFSRGYIDPVRRNHH